MTGGIALITGAARGIGYAIAQRLAEDGWAVMLGDRSDDVESAAVTLSQETGNARVTGARCDVTDEDAVEALVASVVDRFGALDLLVVNAGIGGGADHLTELSTEAFDTVISVNLRGAFLSVRAAAKVMQLQGSGSIVTVGSVYARVPVEGSSAYSASKAGLIAMTKTAALELAPFGITVNVIAPGYIDTPMRWDALRNRARLTGTTAEDLYADDVASVPLRRYGTGADVAGAVAFFAGSDSRYVTAQVLELTGGRPL
jgi:3-oxoacyl-[acyl-carrier protein] reductase